MRESTYLNRSHIGNQNYNAWLCSLRYDVNIWSNAGHYSLLDQETITESGSSMFKRA